MSTMTRSEFEQWQHHFITQEFFLLIKERVKDVKDLLATSAGMDSNEDNFRRGYIAALHDIGDFFVNYPQEENE